MIGRTLCAAVLALVATPAVAQFPTKPVTMIVPFAAGGPTDTVARTLGGAMQTVLKQTVLVENVAGAGGTIGVARVARAAPDGSRSCSTTSGCPPSRRCTASSPSTRSRTSLTSGW